VRHPIYLGFILAFWAAPTMTVGHLVFAVGTLGYIVVAVQLEERDLVREYGARYLDYRQQVRSLVPIPRSRASGSAVTGAPARRAGRVRSSAGFEQPALDGTPGTE
jgi:methanethiol S-methyltransferase